VSMIYSIGAAALGRIRITVFVHQDASSESDALHFTRLRKNYSRIMVGYDGLLISLLRRTQFIGG
jgi:hypothetical protein